MINYYSDYLRLLTVKENNTANNEMYREINFRGRRVLNTVSIITICFLINSLCCH
jgi:hypothetical protein